MCTKDLDKNYLTIVHWTLNPVHAVNCLGTVFTEGILSLSHKCRWSFTGHLDMVLYKIMCMFEYVLYVNSLHSAQIIHLFSVD